MDSYQAIYDAVRSRLSHGDIGQAVESAMRDANLSHHAFMVAEAFRCAASEQTRPCVLFRPTLTLDGNQWCALYGSNLQDGVAGYGDTPADAMFAFDNAWTQSCNGTGKARR